MYSNMMCGHGQADLKKRQRSIRRISSVIYQCVMTSHQMAGLANIRKQFSTDYTRGLRLNG